MPDVSFEGETSNVRQNMYAQGPTGIPAMLIKWKVAKDEKQAQLVQLIVIGVCLLLSIYFFFF